mgnify:CR=1 FL=1
MLHQKFLQKVISEILEKSSDLSGFSFIIPGKRPVVFIKEILKEIKKCDTLCPNCHRDLHYKQKSGVAGDVPSRPS